jgi:hypothetical protein
MPHIEANTARTGSETPTDLGGRAWEAVLKRTVKEVKDDNLTDWAAALTYYGILSIFPRLGRDGDDVTRGDLGHRRRLRVTAFGQHADDKIAVGHDAEQLLIQRPAGPPGGLGHPGDARRSADWLGRGQDRRRLADRRLATPPVS